MGGRLGHCPLPLPWSVSGRAWPLLSPEHCVCPCPLCRPVPCARPQSFCWGGGGNPFLQTLRAHTCACPHLDPSCSPLLLRALNAQRPPLGVVRSGATSDRGGLCLSRRPEFNLSLLAPPLFPALQLESSQGHVTAIPCGQLHGWGSLGAGRAPKEPWTQPCSRGWLPGGGIPWVPPCLLPHCIRPTSSPLLCRLALPRDEGVRTQQNVGCGGVARVTHRGSSATRGSNSVLKHTRWRGRHGQSS